MSEFSKDRLLSVIKELLPEVELMGEIERLNGGNINFVWRTRGEEKNLVIKQAPPHIATNTDVPLSDKRIDFEARALKELNEGGRLYRIASSGVRPPKLYAYDEESSLIIMEDVGDFQELSSEVLAAGSPQKIGEWLGTFIGDLHRVTFQDVALGRDFDNLDIQNVRNQLQYQPAWKYAGLDDSELEREIKKNSQDLGNRLLEKGRCLVMGDLWPPSVFVGADEEIRLIDWEFVHYGCPLQDVGHFAAHCCMQGQIEQITQKTNHWELVWKCFLNGYKDQMGSQYEKLFDRQEIADIGIHIGTEILIRTFGPFKSGYLYQSYTADHKILQEAKKMALVLISNSEATREIFDF